MEGQCLTPLLVFILPHFPSKYIGSSRDRSAVSTQVANAMTTTSDDTPSPFSRSVGPPSPTDPIPHYKDRRKNTSQGLRERPKSPFLHFLL